jgi:hypothetical protein
MAGVVGTACYTSEFRCCLEHPAPASRAVSLTTHTNPWALRELEVDLDVIVTPVDNGRAWNLTDLLGRPMGRITEASAKQFTIHPEGHALETMTGIEQGPFASLDAALAAIEKHTRGVCRRNPGEDQP